MLAVQAARDLIIHSTGASAAAPQPQPAPQPAEQPALKPRPVQQQRQQQAAETPAAETDVRSRRLPPLQPGCMPPSAKRQRR